MNQYEGETRGTIQCKEYIKQVISFEGMRFAGRSGHYNVTPSDIDGAIQLDKENAIVFFELKHSGGMPEGQKTLLSTACDYITAGGGKCAVFLALHNTPANEVVKAKDTIVIGIYWHGKWRPPKESGVPLYESIKNYIEYLHEENNKTEVK